MWELASYSDFIYLFSSIMICIWQFGADTHFPPNQIAVLRDCVLFTLCRSTFTLLSLQLSFLQRNWGVSSCWSFTCGILEGLKVQVYLENALLELGEHLLGKQLWNCLSVLGSFILLKLFYFILHLANKMWTGSSPCSWINSGQVLPPCLAGLVWPHKMCICGAWVQLPV